MKKVGILYDNISGNIGDRAIGITVRKIVSDIGVEFDELVPGRFNSTDYATIIIGGGHLLRPSPDFFYDKFRVSGGQILNCCGIVGFPDDLEYLDSYTYVSVRSRGDQQKLANLSNEVKVVPCTAMLLDDSVDVPFKVQKPSIGVQISEGALDEPFFVEFLSKHPFHKYFLPITHYTHDYDYLARLSLKVKNSSLLPILKPQEISSVIGKFDYFITGSLHGAIFAYIHNVPLALFEGFDKHTFFMKDRKLDRYLFKNTVELESIFEQIQADPPDYSSSLRVDLDHLREHKEAVKDILRSYLIVTKGTGLPGNNTTEAAQLAAKIQEDNFQITQLQMQMETATVHIKRLQQGLSKKNEMVSALNNSVHDKDRQLKNLDSELDVRTAQIAQLNNSVQDKDTQIETNRSLIQNINNELERRSAQIAELSNSVHDRDRELENLGSELEITSGQNAQFKHALLAEQTKLGDLGIVLESKNEQIKILKAQAIGQNEQIEVAKRSLQEGSRQIVELKESLRNTNSLIYQLQKQLDQIQHGIPMRLRGKYQKILDRLLRPGSARRRYYQFGLKGIRVILNEGWRSLFRKTTSFVKRKIFNMQQRDLNKAKIPAGADIGYCIDFFKQKDGDYIQKLVKFNPSDTKGITRFLKTSSTDPLCRFALLLIKAHQAGRGRTTMIVDQSSGGGANVYSSEVIEKRLEKGELVVVFTFDVAEHLMKTVALNKDYRAEFSLTSLDDLISLLEWIPCGEIFQNSVVTFPKPLDVVRTVSRLKRDVNCRLTVAVNDFYAVCPTINLLKADGQFCGVPDINHCEECFPRNQRVFMADRCTIGEWRNVWGSALASADKILCFSESTWVLFNKAYSLQPEQVEVRPHELPTRFTKKPKLEKDGPLSIGVVGSICYHKGSEIVVEAAKLLAKRVPKATITVIGTLEGDPGLKNLKVSGPYKASDLPDLLEKYRVNVCLFPSICPETFSYVCSELMDLGMPICCFGLGAQGERIAKYKLGNVVSEISPQAALEGVIQLFERTKGDTR